MPLFLLTALHFCVDGVCAAVMAAYAVGEPFIEPIVFHFGLYNLIAFGGQGLMGWLLDIRPRRTLFTLGASFFALLFGAMAAPHILAQTIALGLGNCAFHVSAGRLVLRRYESFGPLGLFVSSGAVGLGLGLGQLVGAAPFLAADALATGSALWLFCRRGAWREALAPNGAENGALVSAGASAAFFGANAKQSAEEAGVGANDTKTGTNAAALFLCAVLLLTCVVLRGFGGGGGAAAYGMLLPCVLAGGKVLGGLVCDRIGYRRTVLVIFLLGFAALQGTGIAFALLLTLAFNMTMPLTLRLAHWCRPAQPGLMFGLAAGCLLPGVFFGGMLAIPQPAMIVMQFLALVLAGILLRRAYAQGESDAGEGRAVS